MCPYLILSTFHHSLQYIQSKSPNYISYLKKESSILAKHLQYSRSHTHTFRCQKLICYYQETLFCSFLHTSMSIKPGGLRSSTMIGQTIDWSPTSNAHVAPPLLVLLSFNPVLFSSPMSYRSAISHKSVNYIINPTLSTFLHTRKKIIMINQLFTFFSSACLSLSAYFVTPCKKSKYLIVRSSKASMLHCYVNQTSTRQLFIWCCKHQHVCHCCVDHWQAT